MLPQNRDLVCSYLIDGDVGPINHLPLEIFYYILKTADTRTNLEQFVDKHINQPWNWGEYGLSNNPFITPEFVERHLDKPWYFGKNGLSSNTSITLKFIEDHIDEKWDWGTDGLSNNPIVTMEFVKKYIHRSWEWGNLDIGLLQNPLMNFEFIKLNLQKLFDSFRFDSNEKILVSCSGAHPIPSKYFRYFNNDEFEKLDEDGMSCTREDIFEYVEKHTDKPWIYEDFSNNPHIPHKFIIKYRDDLFWGKGGLSKNPAVTPDFVEKHPDQKWLWGSGDLSSNTSITMKFVEDHIDEDWCWGIYGLSHNTAVTPKFIRSHRNKPWKFTFHSLSSHRMLHPIGSVIVSMISHN